MKLARAVLIVERAEAVLVDPQKTYVGILWRQDVVAFRYLLDLLGKLGIDVADTAGRGH